MNMKNSFLIYLNCSDILPSMVIAYIPDTLMIVLLFVGVH